MSDHGDWMRMENNRLTEQLTELQAENAELKHWMKVQADLIVMGQKAAWDAALSSVDFMCDGVGKLTRTFEDWQQREEPKEQEK